MRAWAGFIWLRIRPVADYYENGNGNTGSIKRGDFFFTSRMTITFSETTFPHADSI
jgi:hypothetical protein